MQDHFRALYPQEPGDPDSVYRATIRAKACDTLRGMLPVATRSNVGIYATGQSYEQMLLRLRSHPLAEIRAYADLMLVELRKVIPAFLSRVDHPDRGVVWSEYLAETAAATRTLTNRLTGAVAPEPRPEVTLTDWDPEGEIKVVAAALYASSNLPDDQLLRMVRAMPQQERETVLRTYVGHRRNRRHRPGRAFERTSYRFDILCDFGAFRDLQRHRMLTLEWQRLAPEHGYETPPAIEEAGALADWTRVMEAGATLYELLRSEGLEDVAQYALPMAFRVRFVLHMNAREAMHVCELRSSPQGHPVYRRIALEMARQIGEVAGHRGIAAAMSFLDASEVDLERLEAERRAAARLTERRTADPSARR
jgi:thymidylate synthase ThyX